MARLPRPLIVLAACDCARTSLRFVPDGELRPLKAIEAAEAWAADPTEENLQKVRTAYAAAARVQSLAQSADLVRARIPVELIVEALK